MGALCVTGKRCEITVGQYEVTIGHYEFIIEHTAVTMGHCNFIVCHCDITVGYCDFIICHCDVIGVLLGSQWHCYVITENSLIIMDPCDVIIGNYEIKQGY